MIVLVTGLPGAGKTLFTLDWVKRKSEKEMRPVFYARIKGLTIPGWQLIDPFKWMDCPANSIIVIDECQQAEDPSDPKSPTLFGVRQRGATPPAWAAALEVHRHRGVDLVIITQDPMLLDAHDRKLVGLHFHVKRTFGLQRATVHEFNGCRPNVAQSQTGSVRLEWSYPKDAFAYYQSAEVHTVKARVPTRIWVFLSLPFLIVGICWYAYVRFLDPNKEVSTDPQSLAAQTASSAASAPPVSAVNAPLSAAQYLAKFEPRVEGLDYTAPAYDDLTKVSTVPYPAACVAAGDRCACYSQQATLLDIDDDLCRSIVARGFFVAWNDRSSRAAPSVAPTSQPVTAARQTRPVIFGGKYAQDIIADVQNKNGGPTGGGGKAARFPDQTGRP